MNVLCVGGGSIGERHLRCFQQTEPCVVSICESLDERRERLMKDYEVEGFASIDEAVRRDWDLVIIATPANLHIEHALAFGDCTKAWMIEKPLSTSLDRIDELREASEGRVLNIAYVFRNHPALQAMRKTIEDRTYGEPLQLIASGGQHFPTFRPAYRDIYYADRRTGGGAIQDGATHTFDMIQHLVGPLEWVFCDYAHQALEGVDVEDTVHLTARAGNVMVNQTLNQFGAPNETSVQINAKDGSVRFESDNNRYGTMRLGETEWAWSDPLLQERDDLFRRQARRMVEACTVEKPVLCPLEEAVQALKVNRAALASRGERVVRIE